MFPRYRLRALIAEGPNGPTAFPGTSCDNSGDWCRVEDIQPFVDALHEIKYISKRIPAGDWTPEFREVAGIVLRVLRSHDAVNVK